MRAEGLSCNGDFYLVSTRARTHTHWLCWLIYLALVEWHKQRAAAPRRENSSNVYSVFCWQGWDCTAAQRPARCSERARPPPSPPPPPLPPPLHNKSLPCNGGRVTCITGTVKPLNDKPCKMESHAWGLLLAVKWSLFHFGCACTCVDWDTHAYSCTHMHN